MVFNAVIIQIHVNATNLSAQIGVVSLGLSDMKKTRLMYSAKMMAMMAAEPGFSAVIAVQEKRNADNGPKIWCRYAYAPPLRGIADPSSAYDATCQPIRREIVQAPVQARQPATTHTIKLIPTLPALRFTNAGELKIPLPI